MIRILIFCEGQTEEEFVKGLIVPHFSFLGAYVSYKMFHTKMTPVKGSLPKGGLGSYEKVKKQIVDACKHDRNLIVTTMIDFYGLPDDFSRIGLDKNNGSIEHAIEIENRFYEDIQCRNFIANLVIHEFEALLFSKPSAFQGLFHDESVKIIQSMTDKHETPEHINSGVDTSPSKRLINNLYNYYDNKKVFDYNKRKHGFKVASDITLQTMREKCRHFNDWITRLENLINP